MTNLVDILVCPRCGGSLHPQPGALVCAPCALAYPVRDGIPVMLVDEAVPASPDSAEEG